MKNYTVNIKITPLKAVNDPRGTQVMNGLENLGYSNLNNVSVGKYIVISIKAQNKEECENMIKKAQYKDSIGKYYASSIEKWNTQEKFDVML